jgi:hypothetical protein
VVLPQEWVYLKLQPFAQYSVTHRPCAKLPFKYIGPSKIIEKYGSAAYKLLLPELASIHLVSCIPIEATCVGPYPSL